MPISEFIATNTDDAAYQFGQVIGFMIVLLGCTLGIVKCFKIMKRPTTHSLCVLSMVIFLCGWFISSIISLIDSKPDQDLALVLMLLRTLLFLAFFGALVVAIVGLCLYDKSRYNQGRSQAVWTISLVGVLFLIGISAFVVASTQARQMMTDSQPGDNGSRVVEIEAFNFSIEAPDGWAQIKPDVLNPEACFAIRRLRPELYSVVLAEKLTIERQQMVEIVKSNLELAAEVYSQSISEITLGELEFSIVRSRAKPQGMSFPLQYETWVCTQDGFVWQVIFWGKVDEAALGKEARRVMNTFKLIDPDVMGANAKTLENIERPQHGYRADLKDLNWMEWVDEEGVYDHAAYDLRAERLREVMLVMPFHYDLKAPPMHALRMGMLSTLGLDDISTEEMRIKDWDPGNGGKGQEILLEQNIEGSIVDYRLRIAQFENIAYYIVGWIMRDGGDMDLLVRSMNQVRWIPREGELDAVAEETSKQLASVQNEIGVALYRKGQFAEAADWFEVSYEQFVDGVVLGNAADALEEADMAARGIQLLEKHAAAHPNAKTVGLQFARLLATHGDEEKARIKFDEILKAGNLDDPDDFLGWLQLVNGLEQYELAIHSADAWVKQNPTRDGRRWRAQTYSAAGQHEKAIEIHEALLKEFPKDLKIACSMAELYNDADECQKARVLAESIIKENADSIRALMALGWSQMGLEWYRDAKLTFEKAAQLDPEDDDIKYAIRQASASLGQGDNKDVKTPIEPVALPSAVKQAMDKHADHEVAGGHSYTWLARSLVLQFVEGKKSKRTVTRRLRVETEQGAKNFSSISCRFNPLHERIYLNQLRVLDADGKVISQAKPDDIYVRDEDDGTASDYKILHAQVAGVRQGVVVEWEFTIEDLGVSETFEFRRHLFTGSQPTLSEAVVVTGDVDKTHAKLAQGTGVEEKSGKGWKAWIQAPRKPAVRESFAIPEELHHPTLWIGSKGLEWAKIAGDYLENIEEVLKPDESVIKLAQELCKDAKTDKEKVAAILNHIQKTVGYKAIAFGVRGTRPNAARKTLDLRFGDCKDMSVLMHRMLAAVKVKSHLVLVDTDWMIEPEVPSMDQFNHMVLHVPSLGDDWLVDPTEKHLDQSRYPATGFWANRALILDAKASKVIELPDSAPAEGCELVSHRDLEMTADGWKVEESFSLSGYTGAWMRAAFVGMHPADQLKKVQRILASQGNAQVIEFAFTNLDDVSKPANIKLKYKVRGGVSDLAGHQLRVLPALWEKDYLATKFIDERQTRFRLLYPYSFKSRVTVQLPEGAAPVDLEKWSRGKKSEFSEWNIKASHQQGKVEVNMDFRSVPGEFAGDAYRAFHDAWEQPRMAWDKPLSWSIKGAKVGDE